MRIKLLGSIKRNEDGSLDFSAPEPVSERYAFHFEDNRLVSVTCEPITDAQSAPTIEAPASPSSGKYVTDECDTACTCSSRRKPVVTLPNYTQYDDGSFELTELVESPAVVRFCVDKNGAPSVSYAPIG